MPAELRIDVVAQTEMNYAAVEHATDGAWTRAEDKHSSGEALVEAAGRACYQSWNRPNPERRTNKAYLAHILDVEHLSILRHATVTVYVQGISRSCANELIRHHIGIDFSQLSQRYVDSAEMDYVIPPAFRGNHKLEARLWHEWGEALDAYGEAVEELLAEGKTRKQAREAARAFLPNCAETRIVVTANLQAWRNFIAQRATEHADAEIRELAVQMAWTLKQGFPNAFQDMHLRTLPSGVDVVYFGDYDPV